MPNWCTNILSGPDIGVKILPYLVKNKETQEICLDFEKIVPMPYGIKASSELASHEMVTRQLNEQEADFRQKLVKYIERSNKKLYGHESWYTWCIENWGTKWNASSLSGLEEVSELNEESLKDVVSVDFQTAWSPAIPIVQTLHRLINSDLRLAYYDEAWNFGGVYTISNGVDKDESYDDPRKCPEELRDELDVDFFISMMEESEAEEAQEKAAAENDSDK